MQITTIGLDLAKHWFQVHGVAANGHIVVRRRLWRSGVIAYFRSLAVRSREAGLPRPAGRDRLGIMAPSPARRYLLRSGSQLLTYYLPMRWCRKSTTWVQASAAAAGSGLMRCPATTRALPRASNAWPAPG
jgi:hypothetical protein